MDEKKPLAKSKQSAAKLLHAAFSILKDAGGELPGKKVLEEVEKRVELSDWERSRYEKTGYIRWQSIIHFYTIDAVKAGYLRKRKGTWYLTDQGEEAIKLSPVRLLESATQAYRDWKAKQASTEDYSEEIKSGDQGWQATLDQLEEQAIEGLRDFVNNMNPYEFQDLVAALLHAMGYYISFISPKGKDGGMDIVAYQDPLGAKEPRMKVQVKHRPDQNVPVSDVRALSGLLGKSGDMGLFVTSGHFSNEAEKFARDTHSHIELIDFEKLISLWQEFYIKLDDEEKNLLPLHTIHFLGTKD